MYQTVHSVRERTDLDPIGLGQFLAYYERFSRGDNCEKMKKIDIFWKIYMD